MGLSRSVARRARMKYAPTIHHRRAILLRGHDYAVRGLGNMRIRQEWKKPLADGRLLILSAFPPDLKRGTAADGIFRNRFVAALADDIIIAHATRGGKIERLARESAAWGKPVQALSGDGD